MITEYKAVRASNHVDLNELVTALMVADTDWQPYGAVVRDGRNLIQTLIKGAPEGSGGSDLTASVAGAALINMSDTDQMRNYLDVITRGSNAVADAVDETDIVLRFNELLTQLRSSNVIAPPGDG